MRVCVIGRNGRLGRALTLWFEGCGHTVVADPAGGLDAMVLCHRDRSVALADIVTTNDAIRMSDAESVVVVGSTVTRSVDGSPALYQAAKHGMLGLVRYWAVNRGGRRVNMVSPATFTGACPVVDIKQVCAAIGFLCGPESDGINGENIVVDRGTCLPAPAHERLVHECIR